MTTKDKAEAWDAAAALYDNGNGPFPIESDYFDHGVAWMLNYAGLLNDEDYINGFGRWYSERSIFENDPEMFYNVNKYEGTKLITVGHFLSLVEPRVTDFACAICSGNRIGLYCNMKFDYFGGELGFSDIARRQTTSTHANEFPMPAKTTADVIDSLV